MRTPEEIMKDAELIELKMKFGHRLKHKARTKRSTQRGIQLINEANAAFKQLLTEAGKVRKRFNNERDRRNQQYPKVIFGGYVT